GHDVTLSTLDDADAAEAFAGLAAPPRVVRLAPATGPLGRWRAGGFEEARALVRGADVVHIHAGWAPTNAHLAAACRAEGVPYVVTAHGMLDAWAIGQKSLKKRVYMALWARRMLADAAAVHFTAKEEMRQSMRR